MIDDTHFDFERSPRRRVGRRGVALMMVLSIVAAASILAWAMLSASTLRARIDANAVDAAEATSLAESGASYAMHALQYPSRFRPLGADVTTWFYPGETGLRLWADARGTVDITVTSTGTDTRKIRSTATVLRPGSTKGSKATVEVNVTYVYKGITDAAGFNGAPTMGSNVHITGPVIAAGAVGGSAVITPSTPVTAGTAVAPVTSEVTLLNETGIASTLPGAGANDRTYTWKGGTYIAEKAPTSITVLGLTTLRPSVNPCNVWYSNANVTVTGATINGVLVVRNGASANFAQTCKITAPDGMPALIVDKKLTLQNSALLASKLTVNGAVWIGDRVTATAPDRADAALKVNGAVLFGDSATLTPFVASAQIDITYTASTLAGLTNISTVKTIGGLKVNSWTYVD